MFDAMFSTANFDLVAVCTTAAAIIVLGFSIYLADRASVTNRTFFSFALAIALYSSFNFLSYKIASPVYTIWMLRGIIVCATLASLLLFKLFYVFPQQHVSMPRFYRLVILPFVTLVAFLALTPAIFESVSRYPEGGSSPAVAALGSAAPIFGLTSGLLVVSAIFILIKKWLRADKVQRDQFTLMVIGAVLTFMGVVVLNVLLPLAFNNVQFIIYAPLLFFPFIGLTSLAIFRYRLFNVRVFAISLLTFFLGITILLQVVFSDSLVYDVFGLSQFVIVIIVSIWLLQSTLQEIQQRELIEEQKQELESANKQQEALLHFISHEIKGYLAKGQNAFAAIVEGDYGEAPEGIKKLAAMALDEMRKGVATVMDILNASNLKQGTVTYQKIPLDLTTLVQKVVDDNKSAAGEKNLQLIYHPPVTGSYEMEGDEEKLRQNVVRNLIDNAVKYTLQGSVTVTLTRRGSTARLEVADTGVGITPEDMRRLFTEGGHGKDSIKINVHSTGFGLYIAKQVVVAHGGKIWAESEGEGKGSRFIVELPLKA